MCPIERIELGRQESPSQQELEFLFDCMARGLQTREIVDEYQGTEFPPRQHRWIAEKQRYFDAARQVLSGESRNKHFSELCSLIERFELEVDQVKIALRDVSIGANGIENGIAYTFKGIEHPKYGTVLFWHSSKTVLLSRDFGLPVQEHPLFRCLVEHLGSNALQAWDMWEERVWVALKQRFDGLPIKKALLDVDIATRDLILALARTRHKREFSGTCEVCT
ncbi:MAG: hypothetical protein HWN68_11295 [Desulfobacterales bacterium]|nr:hypothetical protein [Desulfobacterales bacterium]